jgi:plastocyanin
MTPSTKITTIYIRNNTFVPRELTVLPGTGLIWVNDDATVHAIKTTGSHQGMFNSGDFMKGSQWDYTFGANEGTFEIMDTYSNATCVIIVKKGESLVGNPAVIPTTA